VQNHLADKILPAKLHKVSEEKPFKVPLLVQSSQCFSPKGSQWANMLY